MTSEAAPFISLKIWDHSTLDSTLEAAVQELAAATRTTTRSIVVTRSGPNIFTATLHPDGSPETSIL